MRYQLCAGNKCRSTLKNSTLKHLKGQHSKVKLNEKVPHAESNELTSESSSSGCPLAKQQKLDFSRPTHTVSGESLNKLVTGYIVEDMLRISTVDSPSFRRIIDKIPTHNNVRL